jgi:hypothetical protein
MYNVNALRACLAYVAKDQNRFAIKDIHVSKATEESPVRYEATDGYTLIVIECADPDRAVPVCDVRIAATDASNCVKSGGAFIPPSFDDRGEFPNTAAVIPNESGTAQLPGGVIGFDPQLIARIDGARKALKLGGGAWSFRFGGNLAPVLIRPVEAPLFPFVSVLVIVMPMRMG